MTDAQLQEFAKNYRCSHPGCKDWFDMSIDSFTNIARAIERVAEVNEIERGARSARALTDGQRRALQAAIRWADAAGHEPIVADLKSLIVAGVAEFPRGAA